MNTLERSVLIKISKFNAISIASILQERFDYRFTKTQLLEVQEAIFNDLTIEGAIDKNASLFDTYTK